MKKDSTFFLLLAFIILGLAWGPMKNSDSSGSKSSLFSSDISSETSIKREDISDPLRSPHAGKVQVSGVNNINPENPNEEVITLRTELDDGEEVNITGWHLKSEVTGNQAVIGKAALLPVPNKNTESDVILKEGDTVYLSKGYSPIGISFRTNMCTGYFANDRTFYPGLPLDCPDPEDEAIPRFSNNEDSQDACIEAIENVPTCSTRGSSYTRTLSDIVPLACKRYIETNINYDTCVARHYADEDFAGDRYYLYFKSFAKLWRDSDKKEKINLLDKNGLIVDTISY